MKSVKIMIDEKRYALAKKKLSEAGVTWQVIGDQMVDQVIMSERLDTFGLPLSEMSPSVFKSAESKIQGHLETAAWKYIQIKIDEGGRNKSHWMAALQDALKNVVKSNSSRSLNRGYFFSEEKLQGMFDDVWEFGLDLAADHLGVDVDSIDVQKPEIRNLFKFASVTFVLKL